MFVAARDDDMYIYGKCMVGTELFPQEILKLTNGMGKDGMYPNDR